MNKKIVRTAFFTTLVALAGPVRAGIIFTSEGGTFQPGGVNATYGFAFTPVQNITVDSLGFYDYGSNGLLGSHLVGIFKLNGDQLVSTAVTTENSTLAGEGFGGGQFRFTSITGLDLDAGITYRFAAAISEILDPWYARGTNIAASPLLASVSSEGFYSLGQFQFPSLSIGNTYAAGSFTAVSRTGVVAVPEPSSLALFGIGVCVAGIGAARRRRRERGQGAAEL